MSPRIEKLRDAVELANHCKAQHVRSVPFKETFRGQTVWEGVVEVFDISGHPRAKCCYAWSYHDGKETQFTTVLEIPPVKDVPTAVRASIAASAR